MQGEDQLGCHQETCDNSEGRSCPVLSSVTALWESTQRWSSSEKDSHARGAEGTWETLRPARRSFYGPMRQKPCLIINIAHLLVQEGLKSNTTKIMTDSSTSREQYSRQWYSVTSILQEYLKFAIITLANISHHKVVYGHTRPSKAVLGKTWEWLQSF